MRRRTHSPFGRDACNPLQRVPTRLCVRAHVRVGIKGTDHRIKGTGYCSKGTDNACNLMQRMQTRARARACARARVCGCGTHNALQSDAERMPTRLCVCVCVCVRGY